MNRLFHPMLIAALAGVLLAERPAAIESAEKNANGECCGHCGGCRKLKKVCRLVCGEQEVKVDCWGCKCVDFCVPGRSKKCRTRCEEICGECNSPCEEGCRGWGQVWALPKKFVYSIWKPCVARVHTKKVLMHRVETRKIPVYHWEVEYLCPTCESCCEGAELPADTESLPLPPDPQATLKFKSPEINGPNPPPSKRQAATRGGLLEWLFRTRSGPVR